ARAAADANRPILLLSAPDAGVFAGPGWWSALVEAVREAVPRARFTAVLDCGDDAGAAMAAIRAGAEALVFTGRADAGERLAEIAGATGVRALQQRPAPEIDLATHLIADAETLRQAYDAALRPCDDPAL
ncbi:MAG TPA: hypothetical protein VFW46_15880, partial [Stellaceae bacterium]|nr:hypothetical protein [Stellaceae bacterium]